MAFGDPDTTKTEETTEEVVETTSTPEVPAEILKKIENQDAFIEKLKSEAVERDTKLIEALEKQAGQAEAGQSKQELVELIETLKQTKPNEEQEPSPGKEISIDEIVGAVGDKLKEQALEAKRQENLEATLSAAEKALGEDYEALIVAKAASKGMSTKALNDLARDNPLVFRELFIPAAEVDKGIDTDNSITDAGFDRSKMPERKSISKMTAKERSTYMKQLMAAQT